MRLIEGLITSIPCFVLAAIMLMTWMDPMSIDDGSWVRFGVGIMVLEFVLIHSGALMASMRDESKGKTTWEKIKLFGVAFGFYGVFAGAMALAFKSWTLFITYSLVMFTRWQGLVTHPSNAKQEASFRSGVSILYYLLAVLLSVVVPWPELGVSHAIVSDVYPDRGTGHWEKNPETALAAGVVYFTLIGLTELYLSWRAFRAERNSTAD